MTNQSSRMSIIEFIPERRIYCSIQNIDVHSSTQYKLQLKTSFLMHMMPVLFTVFPFKRQCKNPSRSILQLLYKVGRKDVRTPKSQLLNTEGDKKEQKHKCLAMIIG